MKTMGRRERKFKVWRLQQAWPSHSELVCQYAFRTDRFVSVVNIASVSFPGHRSLTLQLSRPHIPSSIVFHHPREHPVAFSLCASITNFANPSNPSSRIKLPLLQSASVTLLTRGAFACHLHIRRLHVLLRETRADFLVRLGVGFFAVARAVQHAFA